MAIQNAGASSGVLVPEHGGLRQLGNWRTTRIAAPIYIIRYLPSSIPSIHTVFRQSVKRIPLGGAR